MNPPTLLQRLETLLESILSAADDPEDRIRLLVADLRRRQTQGRRALGLSLALEKRLLEELCEAEDECAAWEKTSKQALARGDEGEARVAAGRLLEARERELGRRARWEEQREAAARVRAAVLETARRTEEVAHAKTVLLARARCAEALKSITDTLELLQSPQVVRAVGEAQLAAERKEAGAAVSAAPGR